MKKVKLFVIATICISTISFAQSNNSIHLKKGQKYAVENKISTKNSTEAQGQTMETNIEATTTFNIEVNDIVSNNYNLINTVDGVKMAMTMMGQEMNFDSDKKEDLDGPIGSSMKDFIKKPTNVVLDRAGNIVKQHKDIAGEGANTMANQFTNFDASGYGAQMAFEPLPQSLKVGTTWTSKTDNGSIVKTTNYAVKEINGDVATLTLTGTMTTDVKMEQMGMQMTTKTSGKFSGEETVNIKTGVIQTNSTTMDASGNIEVMGQELPTSSKVTTITTVRAM